MSTEQRRRLLMLRRLHNLEGDQVAGDINFDTGRDDGLCWACDGQAKVFPGMPGHPMMLDTSRVVDCPVCHGTGKRPPQRRLPGF